MVDHCHLSAQSASTEKANALRSFTPWTAPPRGSDALQQLRLRFTAELSEIYVYGPDGWLRELFRVKRVGLSQVLMRAPYI